MNGMGKSSVLQALLLLRQSYQQRLLPDRGLALVGELIQLGTARDALYRGAPVDEIVIDVDYGEFGSGRWNFSYDSPEENVMPLIPGSKQVYQSGLFDDAFHYLKAERSGPRVSYQVSDYAVREHRQLGANGEYTAHFIYVFEREAVTGKLRHHENAKTDGLKDQVEAWMGSVSPGVRLNLQPHPGMDLITPTVSFAVGKQVTDEFRATNAGFGIMYSLPVVTALLAGQEGTLILIENPEAHLHPQGQVKIAELICRAAASGLQVIVETHSDHILHGIRLSVHQALIASDEVKFHFFSRQDIDGQTRAKIVSPVIDADGRLDQWPEGFFDEIDKTLEVLLGPSRRS
jgi:predicted ATPase